MAQENTLTTFPLDQYIPVFMEILKKPPISDLANETNSKYDTDKKRFDKDGNRYAAQFCCQSLLSEQHTIIFLKSKSYLLLDMQIT